MPRGRPGPRALAVGLIAVLAATMARAGVGGEISIANDYRYRGLSLTDGRPTALFDLDIDPDRGGGGGGGYASGLVALAPDESDRLTAAAERLVAGLDHALSRGFIADGGLAATAVRVPFSTVSRVAPEIYLGLRRGGIALYASYSPAYYSGGVQSVYMEASASRRIFSRLRLFAHAGVLSQWAGDPYSAGARADFGAGAATGFGGFGLRAEITSVSNGAVQSRAPRTALVLTLTRAF